MHHSAEDVEQIRNNVEKAVACLSFCDLQCTLVKSNLEQLCDAALIGREARDLPDDVAHKLHPLAGPLRITKRHTLANANNRSGTSRDFKGTACGLVEAAALSP